MATCISECCQCSVELTFIKQVHLAVIDDRDVIAADRNQ